MTAFYLRQAAAWLFYLIWAILFLRMTGKAQPVKEKGWEGQETGISKDWQALAFSLFFMLPEGIRSYRWPNKKRWLTIIYGESLSERALLDRELTKLRDLYFLLGLMPIAIFYPRFFPLLLVLFLGRWFYDDYMLSRKASGLQMEVLRSLPEMLSRLLLSLQAGSLIKNAWQETAHSQEGVLYEEMRQLEEGMAEGLSAGEVYRHFGRHFRLPVLGDIGQLMVEGLQLGSQQLAGELETIRTRQVQAEKRRLMEEADRASQQMIFPSILLFLAILILVLAPMLSQGMI